MAQLLLYRVSNRHGTICTENGSHEALSKVCKPNSIEAGMERSTSETQDERKLAAGGLRQRTEALVDDLLNGRQASFLESHTRILDDYFRESFETSTVGRRMEIRQHPYAIIALGGYGRQEQCIHSDLDLLFLFKKSVPKEAEELIREIVYPLWDLGLDVSCATRSLKECVDLSQDFEVLIPLLDARFLCGISFLYSELLERLRNKRILKHARSIIQWLLDANQERHVRFGDATYLLEPNLKESRGGLRDYHTMLWVAKVAHNLMQPRDLEYFGHLSHAEFQELTQALDFIWSVRNRLHHLSGRKCDQLHFEYQIEIADALQFKEENGQQPVERFLGKLHGMMERVKEQQILLLGELGYRKKRAIHRKALDERDMDGMQIRNDMLCFNSPEDILKLPELLFRIFFESVCYQIPLSVEAKRLVREFGYLVDDGLANSDFVVSLFEHILISRTPGLDVLDEMLGTGILVRFIPEMTGIVNRIQYDEYHLYPVDKHSLNTVQQIKTFGTDRDRTGDPLCGRLYRGIKNKKLLLWSALLHDIGKSEPSQSHSKTGAYMARAVLTGKGYESQHVETIAFLVEEHLFLIKTATRRDINDEETAILCARRIKTAERLKMLYLLTVADSISTGPKAWNQWISALVKDLFLKVLNVIENGELASNEAVRTVETKKEKILRSASTSQDGKKLDALFEVMSPRYLLSTPAEKIGEHIDLYQRIGMADFVWSITEASDSNTRSISICAKDRPGLFSMISGIFTLNNLDILDVQVFTWRNHIALDIFEVRPPPDQILEDETWDRAQRQLQHALTGELDLAAALSEKMSVYRSGRHRPDRRPHRINVDNQSSSFFTIVEVFTHDYVGLLYSITDALFRCRLDIWVAKIATKVDQVVDVFYVRDFDGQKVDSPAQVAAVKASIEAVFPDLESKPL